MILHCCFRIQFIYSWEFTITTRLIHNWRLFVQVSQRKCKSISIWQKKCTNRYILFWLGRKPSILRNLFSENKTLSMLLFRLRSLDTSTFSHTSPCTNFRKYFIFFKPIPIQINTGRCVESQKWHFFHSVTLLKQAFGSKLASPGSPNTPGIFHPL